MDSAFVPGTSGYENRLRTMLQRRTTTHVIATPGLTTFTDFLGELSLLGLTVDALVPGSHASDEGFMFLALDQSIVGTISQKTSPVNYEMLDQANTNGTITIPAGVMISTTNVHFKGCRLGSDNSLPFLTLFKQALGNPNKVTAPKYFHGLADTTTGGVFEFMMYSYRVMSPTAFADRAALIAAFVAQNFTQELDGTAVPAASWSKWIRQSLQVKPATADEVKFGFPVVLNPATGGFGAFVINAQCRSRLENFPYRITTPATLPTATADQITLINTTMKTLDPLMQSTHAYPMYQRMNFPDFDSFWSGMTWTPAIDGADLTAVGTHYVYTVLIPILKPGTTNQLLFNYYPPTGAPTMNFLEDNATYTMFGVV
jgi:hypothetical protein